MNSIFIKAQESIRDIVRSRGRGDMYKREVEGRREEEKERGNPRKGNATIAVGKATSLAIVPNPVIRRTPESQRGKPHSTKPKTSYGGRAQLKQCRNPMKAVINQ